MPLLLFICLISIVIYLVHFYRYRQKIKKKYNEFYAIPSLPLIESKYIILNRNSHNFFDLTVELYKKYGSKIFLEIESRNFFVFSDIKDIQVSYI